MADFKTHISVGALGSGLASTTMFVAHTAESKDAIFYMLMGIFGSMLPDIDSDNSKPIKICFNIVSTIFAFFMVFSQGPLFSVIELFIIGVLSFLTIRFILFYIFTNFSRHRGIIHSIPASCFFGLIVVVMGYRFFNLSAIKAWTAGIFICYGSLIHLILDEIYSVDLFGVRIKKSFGTAFKLIDVKSLSRTSLMYLLIILLFWQTPDYRPVINNVLNEKNYKKVHFFPQGEWFKNFPQSLKKGLENFEKEMKKKGI